MIKSQLKLWPVLTLLCLLGLGIFSLNQRAATPVAADSQAVFDLLPGAYLPYTSKTGCVDPGFFDTFDDPGSGWAVVDDDWVKTQYLTANGNGLYRIAPKEIDPNAPYYVFFAPTNAREEYLVEADIRWTDDPGVSVGGIVFSAKPDLSEGYLFGIYANPDPQYSEYYQKFGVLKYNIDTDELTFLVLPTTSTAIIPGNEFNHLKVTMHTDTFTLEINGVELGTWYDPSLNIPSVVGVAMTPADVYVPNQSELRVDNFHVTSCID